MTESRNGDREIRAALSESRRLFVSVGLFSIFVNILMLTGPLFMLQVYDRVLTSRSEATLVTLIGIVAFLFLMMGILDHARGRVLARAGARLQARLDSRVLRAILTRAIAPAERARPATGVRDLEAIQRFFSELPAPSPSSTRRGRRCSSACSSCSIGCWGRWRCSRASCCCSSRCSTRRGRRRLQRGDGRRAQPLHTLRRADAGSGSETVAGPRHAGRGDRALGRAQGRTAGPGRSRPPTGAASSCVTSKTLRLFLQSMMLGLGAWLAIHGLVSFGVMIAASILLGRALAPIDQAVGTVAAAAARAGGAALAGGTSGADTASAGPDYRCLQPRAILEAQGLTVAAPGAQGAGGARSVFPAGARSGGGDRWAIRIGKIDARARACRRLAAGRRLGAARRRGTRSVRADVLGQHIGYLPQEVVLFEGTVAENIARHLAHCQRRGRGRCGEAHRRARDDPAAAGRLRLPGVGGGSGALRRAAPAHRAGPRLLRLARSGDHGRARFQPGCRRDDGARACRGGPQGTWRRGGGGRPPPWRVRSMRSGVCDGGWRPVSATRRREAQVRRLQAGVQRGARQARDEEVVSLPQQEIETIRPAVPRREAQLVAGGVRLAQESAP